MADLGLLCQISDSKGIILDRDNQQADAELDDQPDNDWSLWNFAEKNDLEARGDPSKDDVNRAIQILNASSDEQTDYINSNLKHGRRIVKRDYADEVEARLGRETFTIAANETNVDMRITNPEIFGDLQPDPKKPRIDPKENFGPQDLYQNPDSLSNLSVPRISPHLFADYLPPMLVRKDFFSLNEENYRKFLAGYRGQQAVQKIHANEEFRKFSSECKSQLTLVVLDVLELLEDFLTDRGKYGPKMREFLQKCTDKDATNLYNTQMNKTSHARACYKGSIPAEKQTKKEELMKIIMGRSTNNEHVKKSRHLKKNQASDRNENLRRKPANGKAKTKNPADRQPYNLHAYSPPVEQPTTSASTPTLFCHGNHEIQHQRSNILENPADRQPYNLHAYSPPVDQPTTSDR